MGWNVACGMASRGHEVIVLTTSEFHHLNYAEERELPFRVYEYDFGITHFACAKSYNHWQKQIGGVIRNICRKEKIDLIHHVTFNQYRGLHDVFAAEVPYVIGPIGGAEVVAPCFFADMPLKARVKEALRYIPIDALPLGGRVAFSSKKGVVLASTPQTLVRLKKYARIKEVELLPIISVDESEISSVAPLKAFEPYMLFDGGVRHDKGLKLLIRSLSLLWKRGIRVPVKIAAVATNEHTRVYEYVKKMGLPEQAVHLMPFMKRDELMGIMAGASAFVSTSFRDSGCMALLEAISRGVPSLCLDTPGQFWLPELYAMKLEICPAMEEKLADSIEALLRRPSADSSWHESRASWLKKSMSWSSRITRLEEYYKKALSLNGIE